MHLFLVDMVDRFASGSNTIGTSNGNGMSDTSVNDNSLSRNNSHGNTNIEEIAKSNARRIDSVVAAAQCLLGTLQQHQQSGHVDGRSHDRYSGSHSDALDP